MLNFHLTDICLGPNHKKNSFFGGMNPLRSTRTQCISELSKLPSSKYIKKGNISVSGR